MEIHWAPVISTHLTHLRHAAASFNGESMNRIQTRVFPIICCLALAGCVKPIDCTTMNQLSEGTSTVQNAIDLLGKPTRVNPGENGASILRWESTTHSYVGGGSSMVLELTFGRDGKLLNKNCTTTDTAPRVQEPAGG
jgi:hypothetical protein